MQFNILNQGAGINKSSVILAGEINGGNAKLALLKLDGDNIASLHEGLFRLQQYNSFNQIVDEFLQGLPVPESVCIAVPGPINYNSIKPDGLNWELNGDEIARHTGVEAVSLIHAYEAIAYGVAMLNEREIKVIRKGEQEDGNVVVIAPGKGLAEAGLYWDGNFYHPFAANGGCDDFKPLNNFDVELCTYLQQKFGKVSRELLISESGIVNIYNFLITVKERQEPGWLKEKFNNGNVATVISQHVKKSELCKETMQAFIRYLAIESAQLVLKFNAVGGLFIAGPVAPMIIPQIDSHLFHTTFMHAAGPGSFADKVPIKIIANIKIAILGAASYAAGNIFLHGLEAEGIRHKA